ncbi:MAG: AAA family ATPase [Cyanobacteria bacterium CRU_2_1]|nr:AAA family ATPase [Cyanobacteria bacterium CRU_2_1]
MFRITDFAEFTNGRADCPSCLNDGKKSGNRNLSLVPDTDGAYKCHRGCSPEQIREALGAPKAQIIPAALARSEPAQKVTITPQKVREAHDRLKQESTHAKQWLIDRGITEEMAAHFRLGVVRAKVGDRHLPAVSIPIPTAQGTAYYQKKRVAPWLPESEQPPEYKKWSQYGIPALVWITHQPDHPQQTWLCEGEWDAILLGWAVRHSEFNHHIQVATFTCGCDTIPPQHELDRLTNDVIILYDRNDTPDKRGRIPGEEGAKKVATALGDRGKIALVPMSEDCDIQGWDVSNALLSGFTLEDFQIAASKAHRLHPQTTSKSNNPLRDRLVWNDDLMARAPDYTEWLVQDLLTADELFLLAAGPRAGKSLLSMTLAKAVAEGGEFLGRPCTQGSVIYVCLEDGEAKLKERETAQGWATGLPVAWLQKFKLSELPYLVELAEELDPRLIILDTLSRIKDATISESSAEMSQLLEPLQEMAKEKGCCVLLVHHTGKVTVDNANTISVFDTIRGSSAIRAVCRGSLIIAADDRNYRLYVENGWNKLDLSVVLDANTWTWKLVGQWKPSGLFNASQKEQIIECLKQLGHASIDQIHESTQIPRKSLYEQLSRLQSSENADEKVIKEGSRRKYTYRLALFNTIQQLNSVLNSVNTEPDCNTGYIQQKNNLLLEGDHLKSDQRDEKPFPDKGFSAVCNMDDTKPLERLPEANSKNDHILTSYSTGVKSDHPTPMNHLNTNNSHAKDDHFSDSQKVIQKSDNPLPDKGFNAVCNMSDTKPLERFPVQDSKNDHFPASPPPHT